MKFSAAKTIGSIAAVVAVICGSTMASAVDRLGGQLDLDFSDNSWHAGIDYNTEVLNGEWNESVSDGTNIFVAGIKSNRGWANRSEQEIAVSKYTAGVRDDSFGGDGVAEFRFSESSASFANVSGIDIAANGELVILGSIVNDVSHEAQHRQVFALRLTNDGTTDISGAWGNELGASLSTLPIVVLENPMTNWAPDGTVLPNQEPDTTWTESSGAGIVGFMDGPQESWAVAGTTYIDGDIEESFGWVVNLSDSGTIIDTRGDGDGVPGYQIVDSTYDTNGFAEDCNRWSEVSAMARDEATDLTYLVFGCDGSTKIAAFDPFLVPDTNFNSGSYLNLPDAAPNLHAWALPSSLIIDSDGNLLAGGITDLEGVWVGVFDTADASVVAELTNNNLVGRMSIRNVLMDADGNIYATGHRSEDDYDLYITKWNADYTLDTEWAGGTNGGSVIAGGCSNEFFYTAVIADNSIYAFGEGLGAPASIGANVSNATGGDSTSIVTKVFLANSTQVAPAGAAPEWVDNTAGGTASPSASYTEGVEAQGDDVIYYIYQNGVPAGLTFDNLTGQFSGFVTGADGQIYRPFVCASNKFGHTWTRFTVTVDTGSLTSPSLTGGTTDLDGPVERGTAIPTHTIPVEGNPSPNCEVTAGELPPGLFVEYENCEISGTPFIGGPYDFTVTASNSEGEVDVDYVGEISSDAATAIDIAIDAEVGSLVAGAPIEAYGWGLEGGSDWTAEFHSDPVTLDEGVANALGWFSVSASLPSDIEPGAHRIVVTGEDADGNPVVGVLYLTIAADGTISYMSSDQAEIDVLASTGVGHGELGELLIVGVLAIVAGGAGLARRRRI